jgi:hypothetical protein
VKVPVGATVTVEDPVTPTTCVRVAGFAVMVKSAVVTVIITLRVNPLATPETWHVALVPLSVSVRVKLAAAAVALAGPVQPVKVPVVT